ncbi:hypothetical protein [Paracoccus sp. (in: a-proteobacteria)]|uniref:hypothetical protein n=1 Tax=Paracoccus sp. TaxID=267 RepID=UPI0026DFFD0C|nr:hypothetical protein [Paracoccus sp. (in: a-proteobacteria)]MDO5647615.1 hypothetical protein [Paracoccus sp. (in: a-proteobacteria)]
MFSKVKDAITGRAVRHLGPALKQGRKRLSDQAHYRKIAASLPGVEARTTP